MTRIRVVGTYRCILRILTEADVTARSVTIGDREIYFSVAGKETDAAISALNAAGKEFTLEKDGRKRTFIRKNILRVGIYFGIFFGIIASFYYSVSVTRVTLSGNKNLSEEVILAALAENISLPTKKSSVDCDELAKKIISLDGISSASVYLKGNTVFVSVLEEPPRPDVLDKTDYRDIVSLYDGVITRIITYSGSPAVKEGDTVKKGQVLISCDRTSADGISIKENALGDVYARVWITKETVFPPKVMKFVRTGRTEKRLKFFTPTGGYDGEFSSYETSIEKLYLDGIVPLPYYITTYFETAEIEEDFDFYAVEDDIVKEETDRLEEILPQGIPIRNWYEVKTLDKNILLVIYYEVEIKIN